MTCSRARADASPIGDGVPRTTIGFLLYAEAMRADGSGFRNVLIAHRGATPVGQIAGTHITGYGMARPGSPRTTSERGCTRPGSRPTRPSVLAVEFYPPGGLVAWQDQDPADVDHHVVGAEVPDGAEHDAAARYEPFDPFDVDNFATRRILRTSRLVKVEPYC